MTQFDYIYCMKSTVGLHTIGPFDGKFEIYCIYRDQSHNIMRFIISKRGVCDKRVLLEHPTFFCWGGWEGGGVNVWARD